jgi:hypothetical protein
MLGNEQRFDQVTLAHLWPAALMETASALAGDLKLPADFSTTPRNFLLIPKTLHDAFDDGRVAFVPSRDGIVIREFRGSMFQHLNGRFLHIPRAGEGHVPFKRLLSWFAWFAKGNSLISAVASSELEKSLGASADEFGNTTLVKMVDKGTAVQRLSRLVVAVTLAA